ncbi:RlmE family RNA methyltransferase [Desulfovibrio sp. OttesenSCG-928-F07]|nr:RlmE family RNA methyltransferase [Desulfovibrio sp. OttesenSCG-928-F07]
MKKYRDYYFLKAKSENYPARSVYKLKEINKRFKIFKPGQKVLDLGAAPGSWSLGASEFVGQNGFVLGLDLKTTDVIFPAHVTFMQGDIFNPSPEFEAAVGKLAPFDVVISDMAPNTMGHRATDQARSAALAEEAFYFAQKCLIKGGSFVVKFFMGPDIQAYAALLKKNFDMVKTFKPQSSRSESIETFYIGMGYRGLPPPDPGDHE